MKIFVVISLFISSQVFLFSQELKNSFPYPVKEEIHKHVLLVSKKRFAALEDLAKELVKPARSAEDSLLCLYLWMTENVSYNVKAYSSGVVTNPTAQETMRSKVAVCSGYSTLFKELCDAVRIKCYVVNGYSKGFGYKSGTKFNRTDHAWNVVSLNGEWKLLDATWGAGYVEYQGSKLVYIKKLKMEHFLSPPEKFVERHLPANPMWQLMGNIVEMQPYVKNSSSDEMLKQSVIKGYNYKDSIAQWEMLNDIEKEIKSVESEYAFYPQDTENLGRVYYNAAVSLTQGNNKNSEELIQAKNYYLKAKTILKKVHTPNAKMMLNGCEQGITYCDFYLK